MSTVRRGATPLLLPTRIREPSAAATPRPPAPAPAPATTATARTATARTAAPPSSPPTPPARSARTAAPRPPSTGPRVARRSADEAVDECDKSHSPGPAEPRWQRGQGRRAITGRCFAGPWPGRAAQCTDPTEHRYPPPQPHPPPHRPHQTPSPTNPADPTEHPHPPAQPHTPPPAPTTRPPPPLHATALHGARRAAPAPARREPGASGDGTGPRPSGAHRLNYGAGRGRRRGHEDGGAGYATVPCCATAAPDRPRGPNYRPNPLALTWPRRHSVTWRPPHGNPASPRWPGTSGHHPPTGE